MKRHFFAATTALALLAGAAGGASASADENNAPYKKSCVGIINSFQAAELGVTPVETADEWFEGSVRAYQEMQRTCKGPGVG